MNILDPIFYRMLFYNFRQWHRHQPSRFPGSGSTGGWFLPQFYEFTSTPLPKKTVCVSCPGDHLPDPLHEFEVPWHKPWTMTLGNMDGFEYFRCRVAPQLSYIGHLPLTATNRALYRALHRSLLISTVQSPCFSSRPCFRLPCFRDCREALPLSVSLLVTVLGTCNLQLNLAASTGITRL